MTSDLFDQQAIDDFEQQGFSVVRGFLNVRDVSYLRTQIDNRIASGKCAEMHVSKPGFLFDQQLWVDSPGVASIIDTPKVLAAVASLLKSSSITFLGDQVFVKEAGAKADTIWHQDRSYWALSGHQLASIWIPLDDVPQERSLRVVPGTHRMGEIVPPRDLGTSRRHINIEKRWPEDALSQVAFEQQSVSFAMSAGDALCFHASTVHGAAGNMSQTDRRRVYVMRWAGDDVRFRSRSGTIAIPENSQQYRENDYLDSIFYPRFSEEDLQGIAKSGRLDKLSRDDRSV